MSEPALWRQLRAHLTPFGRMVRVENSCEPGTPDVAYCLQNRVTGRFASGWIELKHINDWPARPGTPTRFEELTLEQVLWIENWPVNAWLLARVKMTYMLFPRLEVRRVFEGLPRRELLDRAAMVGGPRFPTGPLLDALTLAAAP
jgi:hypothetical protein